VPLAPGLEAPRQRVEQPRFLKRRFLSGRPAEKACAQLRVPTDVVPPPHLIFEEARQQEALGAGGLQHQPVVRHTVVEHETVENGAQIRRRRNVDAGLCGHLRVVRQDAGVVQQLLPIDGRLRNVEEAEEEKFQRLPVIACQQLAQRNHGPSASLPGSHEVEPRYLLGQFPCHA
jgi:hypothetical protein